MEKNKVLQDIAESDKRILPTCIVPGNKKERKIFGQGEGRRLIEGW